MTPEQIQLIRESWLKVAPIADTFVADFYEALFLLDPGLRVLFPEDLDGQRRKLKATLNVAIADLGKPELLKVLRNLGARHVGYQATERDYGTVGAAFLSALTSHLAGNWNKQLEDAWTEAYALIATTMQSGEATVV